MATPAEQHQDKDARHDSQPKGDSRVSPEVLNGLNSTISKLPQTVNLEVEIRHGTHEGKAAAILTGETKMVLDEVVFYRGYVSATALVDGPSSRAELTSAHAEAATLVFKRSDTNAPLVVIIEQGTTSHGTIRSISVLDINQLSWEEVVEKYQNHGHPENDQIARYESLTIDDGIVTSKKGSLNGFDRRIPLGQNEYVLLAIPKGQDATELYNLSGAILQPITNSIPPALAKVDPKSIPPNV